MNLEEKLEFYDMLIRIGFKEIEVGFPAASETEYDFLRALIDGNRIPNDVTVQVLTQCRDHIIRKTFEAVKGAPRAIIHFYNSTSVAQREQVFHKSKDEIKKILGRRAGMLSYVGTTDFRVVCAKVVEGDPKFTEAYQALVYQLSKDIGAMASVLHFDVDAIVYTGGMAYEQFFCDDITACVGKIAPVIRMPGEEEMRSLAEGALRVLHGEQEASAY